MNNTRAERDDPAVHQASGSPADWTALCYTHYCVILSLFNINCDRLKVKYLISPKLKFCMWNVPAFTFNQKLIAGRVTTGTPRRGSGIFDWTAYSGTLTPSPLSPSHLRDIKQQRLNLNGGHTTSEWQRARRRALQYESGPYPAGSWKTDAGCTAPRQSGVRWDKHSLMSWACQGLSHDYTGVEGASGAGIGLIAVASGGTIAGNSLPTFRAD